MYISNPKAGGIAVAAMATTRIHGFFQFDTLASYRQFKASVLTTYSFHFLTNNLLLVALVWHLVCMPRYFPFVQIHQLLLETPEKQQNRIPGRRWCDGQDHQMYVWMSMCQWRGLTPTFANPVSYCTNWDAQYHLRSSIRRVIIYWCESSLYNFELGLSRTCTSCLSFLSRITECMLLFRQSPTSYAS